MLRKSPRYSPSLISLHVWSLPRWPPCWNRILR